VQPAELHQLQILRHRPEKLHRDIGFHAQHVGWRHGAMQIDRDARIAPPVLDQMRHLPERSQAFGGGELYLGRECIGIQVASAQQFEGGRLHGLGRDQHAFALGGEADAVDMSRDESRAKIALQFLQTPPDGIDRLPQRVGPGEPNVASAIVGASRPEQFDENAAASDLVIDPALFAKAEAIVAPVTRAA
jgi:hypothetical protein